MLLLYIKYCTQLYNHMHMYTIVKNVNTILCLHCIQYFYNIMHSSDYYHRQFCITLYYIVLKIYNIYSFVPMYQLSMQSCVMHLVMIYE